MCNRGYEGCVRMTGKPELAQISSTLHAVDDDTGDHITFTDYVNDGSDVELWNNPDEERGFRGVKRLYHDERGWRLRELTVVENHARNERILERARARDEARAERYS